MSPEYLLHAVAWSVGGFVLGYVVAGVSTDLHTIKEAVVPERKTPRRRLRPYLPDRALGVVLILLAILSVVGIAFFNHDRAERLDCQSRINGELVRTINERTRIYNADRQALDDLILTFATLRGTEAERRQKSREAFEAYVQTLSESAERRARFPYPDPNEFKCGG